MTNNKREELGDSFLLQSKNVFQSRKCDFLRSLLARVTFITLKCPSAPPHPPRNKNKIICSRVYLIEGTYSMEFVYLVGQFVYLVGKFVYLVGQFSFTYYKHI
jgi:hypothetical protein